MNRVVKAPGVKGVVIRLMMDQVCSYLIDSSSFLTERSVLIQEDWGWIQLIFSPIFIAFTFAYLLFVEGNASKIQQKIRSVRFFLVTLYLDSLITSCFGYTMLYLYTSVSVFTGLETNCDCELETMGSVPVLQLHVCATSYAGLLLWISSFMVYSSLKKMWISLSELRGWFLLSCRYYLATS